MQEVLNFAILKALAVPRPDDAVLFADDKRPVEVLKNLRDRAFALEVSEDGPSYDELVGLVVTWKRQETEEQARNAWIVLQSTMSASVRRSPATLALGTPPCPPRRARAASPRPRIADTAFVQAAEGA